MWKRLHCSNRSLYIAKLQQSLWLSLTHQTSNGKFGPTVIAMFCGVMIWCDECICATGIICLSPIIRVRSQRTGPYPYLCCFSCSHWDFKYPVASKARLIPKRSFDPLSEYISRYLYVFDVTLIMCIVESIIQRHKALKRQHLGAFTPNTYTGSSLISNQHCPPCCLVPFGLADRASSY